MLTDRLADTTTVQTYTFDAQNNPATAYDSPGRRWFEFPASDNGVEYGKVLMEYTLKCFEDGTAGNLGYACGEWDYLSYTYLFDHTGLLDSTALQHPFQLLADAPSRRPTSFPMWTACRIPSGCQRRSTLWTWSIRRPSSSRER